MMKKHSFLLVFLTCLLVGCLSADVARAEEGEPASQTDTTGQDINDMEVIGNGINSVQEGAMIDSGRRMEFIQKGFDKLSNTLSKIVIMEQAKDALRDQTPQPNLYDTIDQAKAGITANYIVDTQRNTLNGVNLQYFIGAEKLGARANPYSAGKERAIFNLYSSYVARFCAPDTINAPTGCGTAAVDGGYFTPNLVKMIIGDATWSADSATGAADFIRAYFGMIPDKLDMSDAQLTFITTQEETAQAALRLTVLNTLMSRRVAIEQATDSSIAGKLFQTYERAGLLSSNDPNFLCAKERNSAIESLLCGMLNKNMMMSKVVMDKTLQHDIHTSPGFIEDLYGTDIPARGSLDRLEVTMLAQRVAQQYQALRDLQMYTAMRAVTISNPPRGSSNRAN
jgi:hypothetical protein